MATPGQSCHPRSPRLQHSKSLCTRNMSHYRFKISITLIATMVLADNTCQGDEFPATWRVIGTRDEVTRLPNGTVRLVASKRNPAGVLSPRLSTPPRADAILLEAFATCDVRGLKFAAFDAATGECIGYWTNPLAASKETHLTAVLSLSSRPESIRLFVGSHGRKAQATFRGVKWTFLRRGMQHAAAVYGARVDATHAARQTFKATGDHFAAARFRVRRVRGFTDSPDLSVRLYRWTKDMATTIASEPLAEFVVPGRRIPGTRQGGVDDVNLAATYLDGARELTVPLSAATQRGETLVLELSVADRDEEGAGFVTFGWINGYDDGMLYENNSTRGRDWDLRLETFDVVK